MRRSWIPCIAIATGVMLVTPATATLRTRYPDSASLRPAGPPPRAPLEGHRYRHPSGVELRYDTGLGAYVVSDAHSLYFFSGLFLRHRSGVWESSESLRGPWLASRVEWIPLPLRVLHAANEP